VGRMEREVGDIRREMRKGFEALNAAVAAPTRHQLHSFVDSEWEETATGSHLVKKVTKREFETWQRERELSADAKRWRKVMGIVWKVVGVILAAVAGWLAHHLMGKP
jgi:hypothetical protein